MFHSSYLIHFNRNHSSKDGKFVSGDGDGDGITDDHHNYAKNKEANNASSGGGAITLDEDDEEEEDDEEKQKAEEKKIREANLKELERREKLKDKNKKKKKKSSGRSSKKKKKVKVESYKIQAATSMTNSKSNTPVDQLPSTITDISEIFDPVDLNNPSILQRLMGK